MASSTPNTEKTLDIKIQMEYYLSDTNLKKDAFFHEKISCDPNGFIDLSLFWKCNNVIKNGWTKEDLITGIKTSEDLELNDSLDKVRRKGNKALPEWTWLTKKRNKADEGDDTKVDEVKETVDPTILDVMCAEEPKSRWKEIMQSFKDCNPSLNVNYGRFKGTTGNFSILLPSNIELKFTETFKSGDDTFTVKKSEGDSLIDFWKNHGGHYEMCTKKGKKGGKNNNNKKQTTYLHTPVMLGGEKYGDITLVKANARRILADAKDDEPIQGKDKDFVLDVLKNHHNYEEKVKDLDFITTGKPEKFGFSRCFFIAKKDGSKIDFSIQKCIEAIETKDKE